MARNLKNDSAGCCIGASWWSYLHSNWDGRYRIIALPHHRNLWWHSIQFIGELNAITGA